MKRSFLNLKSTFMWMVLGTTLFLGACNGTSTESENAGVGAETSQTGSEEATGMVSETEPVQSMSQYFDATIAENKLTVVDFYTTWCGPCKRMDPFVKEVKAENADINVLQVDAEAYMDISQRYNLEGYPTLIFFKGGQVVDRALGYMDKEGIMQFVNRLK
jgi:thioredoxin 1